MNTRLQSVELAGFGGQKGPLLGHVTELACAATGWHMGEGDSWCGCQQNRRNELGQKNGGSPGGQDHGRQGDGRLRFGLPL